MYTLRIKLGFSRNFALLLSFIHIGAIVICIVLPIHWLVKTALILACILNMLALSTKYLFYTVPESVIKLWNVGGNNWWLETANHKIYEATLDPNSLRNRFLVILNFRFSPTPGVSAIPSVSPIPGVSPLAKSIGKKRLIPVIIFADSIEPDLYRRLCAELLIKKYRLNQDKQSK